MPCLHRLTVLSGTEVRIECVTLGELAVSVNRRNQWQQRFIRALNDDDMRLEGLVDPTDVETLVWESEALDTVTIVSLDETTHTILLNPIPRRPGPPKESPE